MKENGIQIKDKTTWNEELKVSPFRKNIRFTEPHRHNSYFEIIYLTNGEGFHVLDQYRYELKPPMVFLVRQEQLHHFELQTEGEGYVVIIKRSFLLNCLDDELKNMIGNLSAFDCIPMTDPQVTNAVFPLLAKELENPFKKNPAVVNGLLKAAIAKLLEQAKGSYAATVPPSGLYHQFLALLRNGQPILHSVQHYASALNTSPQNLNAACRKAIGLSSTQVLAEMIVAESKRLLRYTGLTVAEVAFALQFSDPSNFIKYFKRFTGQTPMAFRSENP